MVCQMPSTEIILGLDPSLRGTGYGVIEVLAPGKYRALEFGSIQLPSKLSREGCLLAIFEKITEVMDRRTPSCVAIENTIFVQSVQTAIVLGCARGVLLLAAAQRGLAVFGYSPKEIKSASAGTGSAAKQQVGFMVRVLLGLETTPDSDAADALAVAMAHAARSRFAQTAIDLHSPARRRRVRT